MTTEAAVLDRALVVMAICMAIQTVLFIGLAIGAFVAWRRATEAVTAAKRSADLQIAALRGQIDRVSATVDEAAHALIRGASAVDDVVTDARDAVGSVRNSVGSMASAVAGPKAALAFGLLKGLQAWRRRRGVQRMDAAVTSEL